MTDTGPDRPDRAAANERQRRYKRRLAGLLPPVPRCVDCGCRAMGADPDAPEPRCRVCWRRTDQGREWNRTRMRAIRLANQIIKEAALEAEARTAITNFVDGCKADNIWDPILDRQPLRCHRPPTVG